MKTMALTELRRIEPREAPAPQIAAETDVLIRMGAIGVCGSDLHYYNEGRIGGQVVRFPFLLGHECAGVVEAVGAGVRRVRTGDRVAIDPAMPCWACDQCRAGRPHTCRKLRFLGCPGQAEGCLSEQIVMPESSLFPIPQGMTLDQAALAEPLSIGVYAARLSIPMQGARVGILGAGPIGMCVMAAARAAGQAEFFVTDKIEERLALARGAGARWAGNPDATDVVGEILEQAPQGMDVVFECCGQQEALDQALELLKPGGKLLIVGIPAVPRVSFSIDAMRHKEVCVQNVRRQNGCMEPALELIANSAGELDFLITHRYPFARTAEAFELVGAYRDGVLKAMIELV